MALSCCKVARWKHQELHINDLPWDILVPIFLRLPLKSIGRAKCTCKLWYATISDPEFIEMQFNDSVKNPGHLYSFNDSIPDLYYVERVSDGVEAIRISSGALVEDPKTSGGLMAAIIENEKCCTICNPITGEQIKVPMDPHVCGNFQIKRWGFGYSSSTKEYKIILFGSALPRTHLVLKGAIYTLGSESWRDLLRVPFYPKSHEYVDCNGTLFWLISDRDPSNNGLDKIGSFNVGSEEFRCWRGPCFQMRDDVNLRGGILFLMKFSDTVACVRRKITYYSIWTLRDKVNEAWIEVYNFKASGSPFLRMVRPIGLWMNCEVLAYSSHRKTFPSRPRPKTRAGRWVTYNANTREFRDLSVPFDAKSDGSPREHPGLMMSHVASLISPRRIAAMDA